VKVGLVDGSNQIVARHRTATPVLGSPERVFAHAMEFASTALCGLRDSPESLADLSKNASPERSESAGQLQLAGVGLAVPGVLDTQHYQLREVVNLPGWLNVPLMEILREASLLPSAVINDANAAALAEHSQRDLGNRSLALVTLGTGVGCGLVLAGNPFGGDHGCAGELGHIAVEFGEDAIECTCGSRGHLESYAGVGGVLRRMRIEQSRLQQNGGAVSGNFTGDFTTRDIAQGGDAGDKSCIRVIDETAMYVGRAIGMICQSVNPAVVLLGGAMTFGGEGTTMGNRFLERVHEEVRATTLVQVGTNVSIEYASLKNDAGILGAAKLASLSVSRESDTS